MAQPKGHTPFFDIQIPVSQLFGFWGQIKALSSWDMECPLAGLLKTLCPRT